MNKSLNYFTLASCLVFGSMLAHAESGSSHEEMDDKIFKMDKNMFKDMDKDNNGKVDEQEYKNHTKKKNLSDFRVWDVDADRSIDLREVDIVSQRSGYSEGKQSSGGNAQSDKH
ncbi:MAG: hypothetical protein ABIR84_01730 [Candidatus Nitrotoga sp.]